MIQLYSYFRSSTAYRVRIALQLKGLAYDTIPVNLVKGEQSAPLYKDVNPMEAVPTLVHDGFTLSQSLAIIEYLDEIAPQPRLIAGNAQEKAYIRQLSSLIATDIHPLTNLRVLKHIAATFGADDEAKTVWYGRWARQGMLAFEELLRQNGRSGDYCLGGQVSMADLCLVPQMYNMRRYKLPVDDLPLCCRIEDHCLQQDAFQRAAPENQPDAPPDLERIHGGRPPYINPTHP